MMNIKIKKYDVFLHIDLEKKIYKGIVLISITILKKTKLLEINAKDFNIKKVKINNIKIDWKINALNETIEIYHDYFELNQKYTIKIAFDWKQIIEDKKMSGDMDGFYYIKKNDKIISLTNLEPIGARKFIPCFDQPNLKSPFDIIIKINLKYLCISNMSIKKILFDKNKIDQIIFFNTTPVISTYLLCIVCGEIEQSPYTLKTNKNKFISGYAIKEDIKYLDWSIKKTTEAITFFENWFKIDYPLDKLDIVSIPNFSSGAMENWGLITFREECVLLYNNFDCALQVKILEVIYHEIVHQWFGNLVTLSVWNDLWLNESTATFFSWMALMYLYPNDNIEEFYWLETKNVYLIDALTSTHPIITNDNKLNPIELFDEITYSKGNSIINYVVNLLGINNLQKAMNEYLIEYIYSNPPNSNKLFEYFNKYSTNKDIDYIELMNKLTTISGFPILHIKLDDSKCRIFYKKFNLDKNITNNFDTDIFIKIKFEKENKIIKLNSKHHNLIDLSNKINYVFNPNNELFAICYYENFKPNISMMNQVELMKYTHDEFILCLFEYINFDEYLFSIKNIFDLIDLNNNIFICSSVIDDLIYLINIYNYSNIYPTKLIDFINNNLNSKLILVISHLMVKTNKFNEYILEKIFTLETIYLSNSKNFNENFNNNFIKMIYKLYIFQNDTQTYNKYYLSKTIFNVIMKYYQNDEFNNIMTIYKNCSNVQIAENIIVSFSHLNEQNFNYVFNNYTELIKSQNYLLFFNSISKILSKQEFIIDWICKQNTMPNLFKIICTITKNIFNLKLIDKISNYLVILHIDNTLIINKIKDILIMNKIIVKSIKKFI